MPGRSRRDHGILQARRKPVLPPQAADLLATYLRDYAKVNKSSFSRDEIAIAHLNTFMGDKQAAEVSPRDLERYKSSRRETLRAGKPITGATINREMAILKTAGEEKTKLLAVLSPELRRFVIMALKTGMRAGEILGLKWPDIDANANQIVIRKNKSGRMRFIPLHPDVAEILSSLPKHGEFVFSDKHGERYGRSSWIRTQFEKALDQAGIRDFHIHDLRHTFASELIMKGADLKTVSELLGHSSTRMTERYSHLSPHHKSLAVNLLAVEAKPVQVLPKVLQKLAKRA